MLYILYLSLIGSVIIFIIINHPVSLGLTLIFHTVLIRIATGVVGGNFWFSYVLFLVFLGGVLILFIYITRLASNELFSTSWFTLGVGLGLAVLGTLGLVLFIVPTLGPTSGFAGFDPITNRLILLSDLVIKIYRAISFKITALLIWYLLYALLVCAHIVNKHSGALRNFN